VPDAQQADLVLTYKRFLVRLHQANRSSYSFHHVQPDIIHKQSLFRSSQFIKCSVELVHPRVTLFLNLLVRSLAMLAKAITPILNVSNLEESFTWFERLGWKRCWDWGDPPTFGSVGSGECEIFLCQDGQGSRGKGDVRATFGEGGSETADKGVWMTVWVDDLDGLHQHCVAQGLDVAFPPTNMPWHVREMHIRHPDGHVFRISQGKW